MTGVAELLVAGLIIGIGGSALMDVWGFALRRGFAIPTLDYALLGRWIAYFPRGRFVHDRIAAAPAVRGERALGYLAHYTIGVAFALLLIVVWGMGWVHSPTIWPALVVGLGTVLAPWLVMQPAMGAGIAGSRTTSPSATRLRNLGTHTVYGVGLYLSALALSVVLATGSSV